MTIPVEPYVGILSPLVILSLILLFLKPYYFADCESTIYLKPVYSTEHGKEKVVFVLPNDSVLSGRSVILDTSTLQYENPDDYDGLLEMSDLTGTNYYYPSTSTNKRSSTFLKGIFSLIAVVVIAYLVRRHIEYDTLLNLKNQGIERVKVFFNEKGWFKTGESFSEDDEGSDKEGTGLIESESDDEKSTPEGTRGLHEPVYQFEPLKLPQDLGGVDPGAAGGVGIILPPDLGGDDLGAAGGAGINLPPDLGGDDQGAAGGAGINLLQDLEDDDLDAAAGETLVVPEDRIDDDLGAAGGALPAPSDPDNEPIEITIEELRYSAFEIYNVRRTTTVRIPQLKADLKEKAKGWVERFRKRSYSLPDRSMSLNDLTQIDGPLYSKRAKIVQSDILPNIDNANPTELLFAVQQMRRLLREAGSGVNQIFNQMAADILPFIGSTQLTFDYTPYKAIMDKIKNMSEETQTELHMALIILYDEMLPRMVVLNNFIASFSEPLYASIEMLETVSEDESD